MNFDGKFECKWNEEHLHIIWGIQILSILCKQIISVLKIYLGNMTKLI